MKTILDVPSEYFMDKSTGKYYCRPKDTTPTYAHVRSLLTKLAMDSYKPARKGAFKKKLSKKQRKQLKNK